MILLSGFVFVSGTIREFLEVQESLCHIVIHTIILVVESCDASIYEVLLPLYFPRSSQEQRAAVLHLPIETECVHNDRRIRIIDNPQHYTYRKSYYFIFFLSVYLYACI